MDTETRCIRCSALLPGSIEHTTEDFLAKPRRGRLRAPGAFVPATPAWIARTWIALRRIVTSLQIEIPSDVPDRRPWRAAFLGLIPGAAQIYNFQPRKALYYVAVWLVLALAVWQTLYLRVSNLFSIAMILWTAWSFHDGLKTAIRINRQTWNLQRSVAAWFAWMFYIGSLSLLAQFVLGSEFIRLRYIREKVFEPLICSGDRIAVNIIGYTLGSPRVGDVVYYNPRKIKIEQGENLFIIDGVSAIERILAGPGETFERKGGRCFRNGLEVSPDEGPMVLSEVPGDFSLTAAPGHYLILHSYNAEELVKLGAPKPPKMYEAAVTGWAEACQIPVSEIYGRVVCIYYPPEHRAMIRRLPPHR